mmetsp:Transcript_14899/g.26109  ORF Transcript_14899/g.26109 Transcript_14899/m.26109 type:complete len:247 (-) Transcript_14899:78-818(-)|eukprot:CAMPEP_0197633408 /NCGR_PEP_ID=MMETSP1338-20131121/9788_1 /TAXON_ID=43686 ORGANISM="Pelagodinium beii, Strain RCC1491" /NCGR_SAMPLE_ID=MMETSP1338 /ASSEMBLY_ACC=CAM_ASM_000754 /LENGTH=246 /DNA_ID=CAMNT_0043205067 /DNA_START=38 /DNA_END=778 /DNA_ORIENTATION=+
MANGGGAQDSTFITAPASAAGYGGNATNVLGDVSRLLEQPRDERLANLERYAKCLTVRFRRRKFSKEEMDLRRLMPESLVKDPEVWEYSACAICLCEFADGEELRRAPCAGGHAFHPKCLRGWLERSNATCPVCRGGPDNDGRFGRKAGARVSADALAEFVTRRIRSTKVDFTVSKTNHERAEEVMKQLRQPMPCLKPEDQVVEKTEEPKAPKRLVRKPAVEQGTDLASIFMARQAARKAELHAGK